MKLYEMTGAPNPRRVRIFLAEKGITVPFVQVDMRKGEHKSPEFMKKNPSGKIPVLELELLSQVGVSWVNGPIVAQMAPGRFKQNPQAKETSDAAVRSFYKRLDSELAHREYMADNAYSIADITGLVTIDFAGSLVDLKPDAELTNLWRWHAAVSSRPSAKA